MAATSVYRDCNADGGKLCLRWRRLNRFRAKETHRCAVELRNNLPAHRMSPVGLQVRTQEMNDVRLQSTKRATPPRCRCRYARHAQFRNRNARLRLTGMPGNGG